MVLNDFLSRQNNDDSNPHEFIPISFNMHKVLQENYYKIDSYLVQTRSQARSNEIKLPEVHGVRKNLIPKHKTKKEHANPIKGSVVKPCIGQGRAGLKRKRSDPINQTINSPSELSQKIPGETNTETGKTNYKQCGYRDNTYWTFNPRCSFPSRPHVQAPPKPNRSNMPRSQESSQIHQV